MRQLVLLSLLAACGPYVITAYRIKQPAGAGFNRRATHVLVRPVDFSVLTLDGKSEAEFLASRSDKQRRSWDNDKLAFSEGVFQGLRHLAGLELYRQRLDGVFYEPSTAPPGDDAVAVHYRVTALAKGWLDGEVEVTDGHQATEHLTVHVPVQDMTWASLSLGVQMRNGGLAFGLEISRYLADTRAQ